MTKCIASYRELDITELDKKLIKKQLYTFVVTSDESSVTLVPHNFLFTLPDVDDYSENILGVYR